MVAANLLSHNAAQSFDSIDDVRYSPGDSVVFETIEDVLKQPVKNKGPTYIWKIANYYSYMQRSEIDNLSSIFSPPFYSNEFGYKICIRAYPNGDGSGKKEFLSLFIVILQGEYDEIQVWPFNKLVSLSIIDQSGRRNVAKFRADPTSPCFQQPITRKYNVATGCPRFIQKQKLISGSYLSDNNNGTLFVQVKFG